MFETRKGWSWFERNDVPSMTQSTPADLPDTAREICLAYARCFSGATGERVIKHLQSITLDRAFGPDATPEMLRHVEGQRQLVSYIKSQCNRGRTGA